MADIFAVFDAGSTSPTLINGEKWIYASGLTGHVAGDRWEAGGFTFLQLDDDGNGARTIPEPATVTLLVLAGLGLIRRRQGWTGEGGSPLLS